MRTVNEARLVGHVVADPEFSEVGDRGTPMVKFTVATNRGPDGDETTEFHAVIAFARLAVQATTNLRKGDPVYVAGRMECNARGKVEIHAREVSFLKRETK